MQVPQDLKTIQTQLQSGALTCEALVSQYLQNIESSDHLNIYIEVFEKEALKTAVYLDQKIKDGESLGKLHGLVVSIKDVLCYAGHSVTAGSKILGGFVSNYSATAIQRLLDEDAIIIGRVNCDEFAMGSGNENSYYGPTKNGKGENRIPGGSSGASAVSVQVNTCLLALGSDTGGSVRQPAGFCGVVGFKPTYGRISRYGLIAYGSSFDQIGLIAHNAKDIATTMTVIAGPDEFDSTALSTPVPDYTQALERQSSKKKFATFDLSEMAYSIQPEVLSAQSEYFDKLKELGHEVDTISFELLEYVVPTYYVLTTAEASSNLSRYDGVRYGYRSSSASNIQEVYTKSRTEGFGSEVKKRIMLGTFVLSAGYYDAYYGKAQSVRRLLLEEFNRIFEQYDHVLLPISPTTAWPIGSSVKDPIQVYLSDIFTVLANLTGMPGVSIPIGQDNDGMPIGLQILADRHQEQALLSTCHNLLSIR